MGRKRELDERVFLVTGAGGDIGRALVAGLHQAQCVRECGRWSEEKNAQ